MADACIFLREFPLDTIRAELLDYPRHCFLSIGTGKDIGILELAPTIQTVIG